MRYIEHAKQIAQSHISPGGIGETEIVILDHLTREVDVGWVFYYQSKKFVQMNKFEDALVGNAPLFVSRADFAPTFISYHRTVEESMAAFKICGDANGEKISTVSISMCKDGASAAGAIKAIRSHSSLGLADAKLAVDTCLTGSESTVATKSIRDAEELLRELSEFGFHGFGMYRTRTAG